MRSHLIPDAPVGTPRQRGTDSAVLVASAPSGTGYHLGSTVLSFIMTPLAAWEFSLIPLYELSRFFRQRIDFSAGMRYNESGNLIDGEIECETADTDHR